MKYSHEFFFTIVTTELDISLATGLFMSDIIRTNVYSNLFYELIIVDLLSGVYIYITFLPNPGGGNAKIMRRGKKL